MAKIPATSRFLCIIGLFLTFTTLTLAGDQAQPTRTRLFKRQEPELAECETPLAGDLYGLGVRLGIYFSWITSWVANTWLQDEIAGGLDGNTIFLLTLVIAVLKTTITDEIMQIDALVLIELSAGTTLGVLSIWGARTCHYRKDGPRAIRSYGGIGTGVRLTLAGTVAVYSLWFFSKGLSGGVRVNDLADPSLGCENINILTVPIQKAKPAIDVFSSISVLYSGVMFLFLPLGIFLKVKKFFQLGRKQRWSKDAKLRFSTGLKTDELFRLSIFGAVFSGVWIIFSILVVELTLNQNKVRGVLGEHGDILAPGQLIPMLVGAFTMLRIFFIAFELWLKSDNDDEDDPTPAPMIGRTVGRAVMAPRGMLPRQDTTKSNGEVDQHDEYARECNLWQRMIVCWAPWITCLGGWPLPKKGLPTTETRLGAQYDEKYTESAMPSSRDGSSKRSIDPASKEPLLETRAAVVATGSSSLSISSAEPMQRV